MVRVDVSPSFPKGRASLGWSECVDACRVVIPRDQRQHSLPSLDERLGRADPRPCGSAKRAMLDSLGLVATAPNSQCLYVRAHRLVVLTNSEIAPALPTADGPSGSVRHCRAG